MTLTKKTNHVAEAQGKLIERFKGLDNLDGFVETYANQIQALEDAYWQLFTERSLDTAIGEQLDGIGEIVGEPRGGLSDDSYRLRLRARILLNISSGTPEQVIEILTLVIDDPTVSLELTELYHAGFELEAVGAIPTGGEEVASILRSAKPAGVKAVFIWYDTDSPFQMATGSVSETDYDTGFGDTTDPLEGGDFANASEG